MTKLTLWLNHMGHLHIFFGDIPIENTICTKYNITYKGRECDLYVQSDHEVNSIINSLSKSNQEALQEGNIVITEDIWGFTN